MQPGGKGPKAQAAAPGVDELVKAKGVPEPLVHQQRGVKDQVVGGDDVQLREVPLHPLGQAAVVAALVGDNQRLIPQVGGAPAPSPQQAQTQHREAGSWAPHQTNT